MEIQSIYLKTSILGSDSRILVCVQNGKPEFGYLHLGKPHTIYQFRVLQSSAGISMPPDGNVSVFLKKLELFENKFTYLQSNLLTEEDFIIGYHKSKFYVATKVLQDRDSVTQRVRYEIQRVLKAKQGEFTKCNEQATFDMICIEDGDTDRIYAKIAMNTLAYIKGCDYVMNRFENLKNWILTSGDNSFVKRINEKLECIEKLVPEASHWCYFQTIQRRLICVICFYNRLVLSRMIDFGFVDSFGNYPEGFICDWKNQKEYSLIDWISIWNQQLEESEGAFAVNFQDVVQTQ